MPATITAAGITNVYFVPTAIPSASPATASFDPLSSASATSAIAASSIASPATSFRASPAWVRLITGSDRISAPASSVSGSTRHRAPMLQAASSAIASHIRLIAGDRKSLRSATIPSAWNSSEFAG